MRIAVDIDDVLVPTLRFALQFFNEEHGTEHRFEDVTTYDFSWNVTHQPEYMAAFVRDYVRGRFHMFDPDAAAIATLSELRARGHELYILTSRSPIIYDSTQEWLHQHFGEGFFQDIIFYQAWDGFVCKSEVCTHQQIDIFIEDAPHYARFAARKGVKVLLMDKPWNQEVEEEYVSRVRDWEEIRSILL